MGVLAFRLRTMPTFKLLNGNHSSEPHVQRLCVCLSLRPGVLDGVHACLDKRLRVVEDQKLRTGDLVRPDLIRLFNDGAEETGAALIQLPD